jgi:hypothetical protein
MIEKWLTNFDGRVFSKDKEDLMALYLLSKFVLLSYDEIRYLCQLMYRQFVHQQLPPLSRPDELGTLEEQIVERTGFYPSGQSSESGEVIAYHFRQVNDLAVKSFVNPQSKHAPEHFESLCLLDDVCLTGDEAVAHSKVVKDMNYEHLLLLVMISTEQARRKMSHEGITVVAPIVLKDDEISLGSRSPTMMDMKQDIDDAFTAGEFKLFLSEYGRLVCPGSPLGYGGLALLLGLPYNVPDNTIPLMWAKDSWTPIFPRYPKYIEAIRHDSGPFV